MKSNDHMLETVVSNKTYSNVTCPFQILVAEDNIINQKLILRILQNMGIQADLAENGLEVLEAVEKKNYNLILMDIQMPKMDGIQAAKNIIKKYDVEKRPRIVAVTACAAQGDKEKFLNIGMDGYIGKPINIVQFKDCIVYWMNRSAHGKRDC
jgi:CheY-like chemotaxis protein